MTRIDQVADDVTELKVMVGKIITTLEIRKDEDTQRDSAIKTLETEMSSMPTKFAKWTVAMLTAASICIGLVYGVVQVAQALGNSGIAP